MAVQTNEDSVYFLVRRYVLTEKGTKEMYMLTFVIMLKWLVLQKRLRKNKPEGISNGYPWYWEEKEQGWD